MGWFGEGDSGGTTTTTKPRTTSGGSSGGWFGGGGSSSGGSSGGAPKAPTPQDPSKNLIRLVARLQRAKALNHQKQQQVINQKIKESLVGYNQEDVTNLANKAALPLEVVTEIRKYAKPTNKSANPVGTLLDYLGRPAQFIQGGIAERGPGEVFSAKGAIEGFTGEKEHTPIETALRAGGQSALEARKTEAGLNPVVRFGGNLAGGVALDPLTYVSFGTTAGSKAAVDTAAEITAASRAAQTGRGFATLDDVSTIRSALRSAGKKALTKEEYAALGPKVKRALRGSKGGVKVAGKTVIPGKAFKNDALAALRTKILNSRPVAAVEDTARTLPLVRQEERAGAVAAGTAEKVAQALRRAESSRAVTAEDWLVLSKAGKKVAPEIRPKLVAALEDPALVSALKPEEKKAFDLLAKVRQEKTDLLVRSGRLQTEGARAAPSVDVDARQVILGWAKDAAGPEGAAKDAARAQLAKPADEILNDALDTARTKVSGPEGSFVGESVGRIPTERYFPRVSSEESKAAGSVVGSPVSLGPSNPGYLKGRELETKFAPTPSIIDKATGAPRFETDPFVATYKHAAQVNADTARVRFIDDVRRIKGADGNPLVRTGVDIPEEDFKIIADLSPGTKYKTGIVKEVPVQSIDPTTGASITRNEKVLVAPELAHDPAFDRVVKILANPEQQQDLLKFYDKTLQLWKSYATTFGPFSGGFGLRNFLGNQLNGYWLTGTNPAWQGVAGKALHQLNKGIKEGDPWKYLTPKNEADIRDAFEHGVLGHGFYHQEVSPGKLAEQLRPGAQGSALRKVGRAVNPISLDNALLKGGRAFNTKIEDVARLGLFMAKRRGGFTPESASSLVQKYLFDYGELSNLDRAAKHVIPFWTWTRKNVPLQLEHLLKTPGAITFQAHALEALRALTPNYNGAALPAWARDSEAAVLPGGKTAYIPDLPITSIEDQLKPGFDIGQMLSQGGPDDFQKLGRDTFLAAQPGGPFAGLPGALTQLATGKNVFSGAQTSNTDKVGPIPAGLEQLLESVAPFGPGLAKVRGIVNSKTRNQKIISGLAGVQTTPLNKKSMTNEQWRRYFALLTLAGWLKKQGIVIPEGEYTK